jgi:hypothetical protein
MILRVGTFQSKFSDEERAAVVAARRTLSAPEVARRAAAGRLKSAAGSTALPAFVISPSTVRDLVARERRKHAGEAPSSLASLEPGQAVEALRRRFVRLADSVLGDLERRARRGGDKVDIERLRQAGRVLREAAALSPGAPTISEQRAVSGLRPAAARADQAPGPTTLAGRMLADHRGTGPGASDPSPPPPAPPRVDLTRDEQHRADMVRALLGDAAGARTDAELAALTNAEATELLAERADAERDPTAIGADELATLSPAEIVARATGRSGGDEHDSRGAGLAVRRDLER